MQANLSESNQVQEADLQQWANYAFATGLPVCLWKYPNDPALHLIIDQKGRDRMQVLDLEELPKGFVFAPFEQDKNEKEAYFIEASVHIKQIKELNEIKELKLDDQHLKAFAEFLRSDLPKKKHHTRKAKDSKDSLEDEKARFISYVEDAIAAIAKGEMEKVVPSRRKWIPLPEEFDVLRAFQTLSTSYPRAFVSLVSIPGVGTWMGASPEILVSIENAKYFKTVALAGTQRAQEDKDPKEASWTQKEIEEQALVARYIINCFKKIRLREFEEIGPKTIQAGNMWHLKTEFKVDMESTNFPQLGTVMMKLLHPTSAICGMPLDIAKSFIKAHEAHDRSFFSGFLGPVNIEDKTQLYVNLRCMEILEDAAILFAGAGVTIDSKPEKEWEETEMKCQTLISVVFP